MTWRAYDKEPPIWLGLNDLPVEVEDRQIDAE